MTYALQKRTELLVENRDIIKSTFKLENTYIYPLCAGLFAVRDVRANEEKLRYCRDLLNQKTGIFSNFRGISKLVTITQLALSSNPETKMERMLTVYDELKEVFFGSEYLALAASTITELSEASQYTSIAQRTREIYNRMKKAHPLLTSAEDSVFSALLAMSRLDIGHIEDEMEECYQILKPSFFSGNAVQSLSHVLALGEAPAEQKCERTLTLYDNLKSNGYKYGTGYELATLGALALLETDLETLARGIMDVDDYLKTQKGFGAWGIGAKQRLMYSGMMSMCDYLPQAQTMKAAAVSGVVSLVIAQQVAICASVAAASAASSSSSSSSS